MKQIILGTLLLFCGATSQLKAQSIHVKQAQQFMQVTTIESVLSGGLGRSKMIVTNPDGSQTDRPRIVECQTGWCQRLSFLPKMLKRLMNRRLQTLNLTIPDPIPFIQCKEEIS